MAQKIRRPAGPTAAERFPARTRILAGLVAFVMLGSLVAVTVLSFGDTDDGAGDAAAPGTSQTASATATTVVPTSCPPHDKSVEKVLYFDHQPQFCLEPSTVYTAVFDTSEGEVRVALDTTRTPNTTNNFIVLADYGYYDDTLLFRLDPTIAIIQGGSPHTNDWSDRGPGYTIADEGGLFQQAGNGMLGPFTYEPGQLIMARSAGPNSSGAQFFFSSGPEVSRLDGQGSYIVFGKADDAGLRVLEQIMGLYELDPASPYGGGPTREVTVHSVTIVATKA
ncbi:MAG: peptidylprolyl isomerase [Acidimicrobiia bacterium]|nr:peptidylprolyl isomerase [Actinomycetota bacterium]MBL6924971.1 peptidylprolyl isomerase [Acidimicrobiia bacterium]MBL6926316.1 peptidylprolyl isomerase [Acidimicrobiia bacterium]